MMVTITGHLGTGNHKSQHIFNIIPYSYSIKTRLWFINQYSLLNTMPMNDLLQMSLFCLLTKPLQESTNKEMQTAYGCFMEQVEIVSQSGNPYSDIYRMLNNTRIELVFLQTLNRYEQGEKCPEICLSSESYPVS